MKTAELIRRLQEEDPSGELEVTVGKTDIHFLQRMPCYYDGETQILKRDPNLEGKCYNIIGAEVRSDGEHVCINTHSIREMLADEPELPVTFDRDLESFNDYPKKVEEWRAFGRGLKARHRSAGQGEGQ